MNVSFVIPLLNEAGIVGSTIKSIPVEEIEYEGYDVEIIVINIILQITQHRKLKVH